jgi:hypothetical protein
MTSHMFPTYGYTLNAGRSVDDRAGQVARGNVCVGQGCTLPDVEILSCSTLSGSHAMLVRAP